MIDSFLMDAVLLLRCKKKIIMKENRKERNKKKEIQKVCSLQACDEYKCTFTVEAQIEFEKNLKDQICCQQQH